MNLHREYFQNRFPQKRSLERKIFVLHSQLVFSCRIAPCWIIESATGRFTYLTLPYLHPAKQTSPSVVKRKERKKDKDAKTRHRMVLNYHKSKCNLFKGKSTYFVENRAVEIVESKVTILQWDASWLVEDATCKAGWASDWSIYYIDR